MISAAISQYGSEVRLCLPGNLDEHVRYLSLDCEESGIGMRSSLRLRRSVSTVTQGGSLTGELRVGSAIP